MSVDVLSFIHKRGVLIFISSSVFSVWVCMTTVQKLQKTGPLWNHSAYHLCEMNCTRFGLLKAPSHKANVLWITRGS